MSQTVLSGRYVLMESIGAGGMSVVYRAIDNVTRNEVAVKVMRREQLNDEEFIRRFDREASAAERMSHENIVSVLNVGSDGDARYIVMEYIKGSTLKGMIREYGRIPPHKAVNIALRILAAADHAHKKNIIHRDLKPQNIMIDNSGAIKVGDFGIARVTTNNTVTYSDGNVLGSVHYLSPEQARGEVVDEKSDLYSIGVVLYEMLTGRVPFEADTPVSVVMKHVQEPPPKLRTFAPEVSIALEEVVLKSLAKDVEYRYQTAAEMAIDLKRALKQPSGGFAKLPLKNDEHEDQPERLTFTAKIRKYRPVVVLAMLCLCALAYIGYRENWFTARVRVPDVLNMQTAEAVDRIIGSGLTVSSEHEYSYVSEKGYVIKQTPARGDYLREGGDVALIISDGPAPQEMPMLIGNHIKDILAILDANGLKLGGKTPIYSGETRGTVIDQSVAPKDMVVPGTEIYVTYSGENVIVPELSSFTLSEAEGIIINQGLAMGEVVKVEASAAPGSVLDQSPSAFTEALEGTRVSLTVAMPIIAEYRREVQLKFAVEDATARVQVIIFEGDKEPDTVFDETMYHGENTVTLRLNSEMVGEKTLRLYVGGKIIHEQPVAFTEKDRV